MLRTLALVALIPALACGGQGSPPDAGSLPEDGGIDSARTDVGPLSDAAPPPDAATSDVGPLEGVFETLTYNVAGLPQGVSGSNPETNIPLISPLLNAYDLVLVQEDFTYQAQLRSGATHPYKSTPQPPPDPASGALVNDGLNRFSAIPFGPLQRTRWKACSGLFDKANDCLATKGFSVAPMELAPGVVVDVYNLHMDAGNHVDDAKARAIGVTQMLDVIAGRPPGRALIVAGDTNLKASYPDDVAALDTLLAGAGLTDACRALACGDERIDRILYRSSTTVELQPLSWKVDPSFVDGDGKALSDHEAIAVRFSWRASGN